MNGWGILNSAYLLYLLALVPLGVFIWLRERTRTLRLRQFAQSVSERPLSALLLPALVTGVIIAALARPYSGAEEIEIASRGRDVMLVLDVSDSMLARDVPPSRMLLARRKIEDIVGYLASLKSGDRAGIVLFAGSSYLYCPLTSDYGVITTFVRSISADMISTPGSGLNEALETAVKSLQAVESRAPVLMVLSDGEDNYFELRSAIELLKRSSIKANIIGIGTEAGSPIQLEGGSFLRDQDHNVVVTRLREGTLRSLAEETGGRYQRATLDDSDFALMLKPSLDDAERADGTQTITVYNEIGPFMLLALLALLTAAAFKGRLEAFFLLALFTPVLANAEGTLSAHQARRAYEAGDFAAAESAFSELLRLDPTNTRLLQALASTKYRLGKFDEAARLFAEQKRSHHLPGKQKFESAYNLGNTHFMQRDFKGAIEEYEEALRTKPDDKQAVHNLALARKMLEKEEEESSSKDKRENEKQDGKSEQPEHKESEEQESEQSKEEPAEKPGEQDASGDKQSESEGDKSSEQSGSQEDEQAEQEEDDASQGEQRQASGPATKHDPKALSEREAAGWLDSLEDSPVLLQRQPRKQRDLAGQTW